MTETFEQMALRVWEEEEYKDTLTPFYIRLAHALKAEIAEQCTEVEMRLLSCNKCGWVHVGRQREQCHSEIDSFNVWYALQPASTQEKFGGKSASITTYEKCFRCGNSYKDFRETKEGEAPTGSTIQPIIDGA